MSAECDNCSQPRPRFPVGNVSAGGRRSSEGEARDQPEGRRAAGEHRPDFVCTIYMYPLTPTPSAAQPPFPPGPARGWEDRVACLITHSGNLEPKIRSRS